MLIILCGLLSLTSCQENEEVAQSPNLSAITFQKDGDPRNPTEFMNSEEIQYIQNIFNSIKGKKLKNPVEKIIPPLTRGNSEDLGNNHYELSEYNAPVKPIDGNDWLFVNVVIQFYDYATKTFDVRLSARVGTSGSYKTCYTSKGNTNTYIDGGYRLLVDNATFTVPLKNTPNYNTALVRFPIPMEWDERVGYEYSCELNIRQSDVFIQYLKN